MGLRVAKKKAIIVIEFFLFYNLLKKQKREREIKIFK